MGGRPKALLEFRGRTFIEHVLAAAGSAGITNVVVVVGHHRNEITSALRLPSVVFNPDYEQGMSTSVQAGIKALPQGIEGAGIFLVDQPLIDAETIVALSTQLKAGRIVLPFYDGHRGHPVFFASDLFEEILELPSDQGLNTVVRRIPGRVTEVVVTNSGVLRDIDTPEEFENLLRDHH